MSYKWSKAPDGTYTIWAVEIFSVHTRTDANYTVKEDDLVRLADKMVQEQLDHNYLPPVHAEHHTEMNSEKALFRLGCLANARVVPKTAKWDMPVLIVDLVGVNEEGISAIKRNGYLYRSIEGLYSKSAKTLVEIASLALMESDVPFFKFPILALDNEETTELPGLSLNSNLVASYSMEQTTDKVLFTNLIKEAYMAEEVKPEVKDNKPADMVEDKKQEEVVPAWAVELKTLVNKVIDILSAIEPEQAPNEEEALMSMMGFINKGFDPKAAIKLYKSNVKPDEFKLAEPKKEEVKVDYSKASEPKVEKPEDIMAKELKLYHYEEMSKLPGFKGLSGKDYLDKVKKYGHYHREDLFSFDKVKGIVIPKEDK